MSNQTDKNDVFSTVEETVDNQIKSTEKSFPNYQTSVTSLQQEYTEAFKNVVESSIALQRELLTRLESTPVFHKQQKTLYANQTNRLTRYKMFRPK